MAKMFPSVIPDNVASDPKRAAEIRMYECLRDQLDGGFHVFYSSPWLGTRPDGSEVDGEADFLVAHPELGILSIEVKGGGVAIDVDSQWTSRDRHGIERRIKNPVEQARSSKHQIIEKLKASSKWNRRFVRACHGVILPDVTSPGRPLRADMPLELFAFREDVVRLNSWVKSRFQDASPNGPGPRCEPLGNDGLAALDSLLAEPIRLKVPFAVGVDHALSEIKLKTDEQIWILRDLEENRRMTIAGAAGTGKTILAVEKALMLAEEGKRTLLLCFNRPLSAHLREIVGQRPNLTVTHFDKFCRDVSTASGHNEGSPASHEDRSQLVENFVSAGMEEFDAIVIDEGQDFKDEWLTMLEIVVKGSKEGILYVFYDDNQNVTGSSAGYISTIPASRYRLTRNFRNTRQIFEETKRYYRGSFVKPVGPEGEPVEWHECAGVNLREMISQRIGVLLNTEKIEASDVAILVPTLNDLELLRHGGNLKIGRYQLSDAESRRRDSLVVDSIRRFKGLESPVVLLIVTGEIEKYQELLYTGISRAQVRLELFGPAHILRRLRA
jgi:hypothetical protein